MSTEQHAFRLSPREEAGSTGSESRTTKVIGPWFGSERVQRPLTPTLSPRGEGEGSLFDRMIVTAMLEKALGERDRLGGALARRLGVGGIPLAVLLWTNIPAHPVLAPDDYVAADECDEQEWVRDLLLRNLSDDTPLSRAMAAIVARRAMQSDHLWEDLGLPDRPALTRLMQRHFAPLAALNEGAGMRWKRFLYRQLCEEEGMTHCTSPTCSTCVDVDKCFEPASAEASIARAKQAPR